jgi:hypothetical protein
VPLLHDSIVKLTETFDWDTYLLETYVNGSSLSDAQSWANSIVSDIESGSYKSQAASWIDGDTVSDVITTATRWASDANAYVCSVVMPNGAAALENEKDLYPTYYNSAMPTIELQIAKGGYRLGNWLNMVYKSEIASKKRQEPSERRHTVRDLSGKQFLPEPRELSKAKLARAAMGGSCCKNHKH